MFYENGNDVGLFFILTLKCFRTYIFPTAAEKLPLAEPTQDFHLGVVAFFPVTFLEYSSIISLAS